MKYYFYTKKNITDFVIKKVIYEKILLNHKRLFFETSSLKLIKVEGEKTLVNF